MKTKRIVTGVLAGAFLAAMSAVSASAAAETEVIKLGDPTGDGVINAVDASNILSLYSEFSIEMTELTNEIGAICDVNRDGSVDAVDASMVLSYYASQSSEEEEKSLEQFIVDFWEKMLADQSDDTLQWLWKGYDPEDILNNWEPFTWWEPYSSWEDIIDPETGEVINPWNSAAPWAAIDPETGEPAASEDFWNIWSPTNSWNPWLSVIDPETGETIPSEDPWFPWSSTDPWNPLALIDPETGEITASEDPWSDWYSDSWWNPWLSVVDPETGEVSLYTNPWVTPEEWYEIFDTGEQPASEKE